MGAGTATSVDDVFINCPFDDGYQPTFEALVFCIFACGFRPRSGKELDDASQTRIEKLYTIIETCRFGVHDLSRTALDDANKLPRFNMPFELGLFLGAKRFGEGEQKLKRCIVMEAEPNRHQKFISDLAGMDVAAHGGDPAKSIELLRDWLKNVSRRNLPSAQKLNALYKRFATYKSERAAASGFDPKRIPYADYEDMVTDWLLTEKL